MDIAALRAATSGCRKKVHLNNAGASLMPDEVIQAIRDHLDLEIREGGYEAAEMSAAKVNGFYTSTAKLIGAESRNIAFTSSATSSFARALSAIPFRSGDSILIAGEDYISNQLAFLSMARRFGIRLLRAPMRDDGGLDLDAFRTLALKEKPKLISLTHVPTNSGLIQPAEAVGQICRETGSIFLLDACQSVGQLPVDVHAIGCHFLSSTFRKFLRGPRGAGFLFVSDQLLNGDMYPLFIDMRGATWTEENDFQPAADAKRFEEWEVPYALVLGSAAASALAVNTGISSIAERNAVLTEHLHAALDRIGWTTFDPPGRRSAIVTTHLPGTEPKRLLNHLRANNINASISYRNFALPDMNRKNLDWVLRLSPHYYNTAEELEAAVAVLKAYRP